MMKKIFIKELEIGGEYQSPFLVVSLNRARTNRGGAYLNVELGDRSGRLAAKVWDAAEALEPHLAEGSVALVKGYVDSYRGAAQFVIREARSLKEGQIAWEDYLRASPRPPEEMKAELDRVIRELADADFRALTGAALADPEVRRRFTLYPAAKALHHAYLHGLLEHSLSVAGLARLAADHYPKLNRGLLVSGALLHDLGKIWEFTPPPRADYSTLGRLKGHLVMGCEHLGRTAETLPGFPPEKLELLQHLILSHHGEPEFGAPVRPQLLEAIVLHHLDNIDAKLEAVDSFLDHQSDREGWSGYHQLFGGYFRRTPALDPGPEDPPEPEKPLGPDPEEAASLTAPADQTDQADPESEAAEDRLF